MKSQDIVARRLYAQQINSPRLNTAPELVKWFGAVQGQEYALTKWGLGLRLPLLKDNDIEKDLNEGRILRIHLLRPTWHLIAADDMRWMLLLSAPRVNVANAHIYKKLDLDKKTLLRCRKALVNLLEGGRNLTRSEMSEQLNSKKIIAKGIRLAYIMMDAELEGIVCSGPRKGTQHTYMLLDERISRSETMSREQALAELTRRYFFSRGPATVKDFSTWSGLTITECRQGVDSIRTSLVQDQYGDEKIFYGQEEPVRTNVEQNIHLLPVYDEYIMGYKDRSAISPPSRSVPSPWSLSFDNTIIDNGHIVGSWKRTITGKSIEVRYTPLPGIRSVSNSKLTQAIGRFHQFLSSDLKLSVIPPH